jgi:hypothetical protein
MNNQRSVNHLALFFSEVWAYPSPPASWTLEEGTAMLGLTLRQEFRGRRLKGTAIKLANDSNTGATEIAASSAASRAVTIYNTWAASQTGNPCQGTLLEEDAT